MVLRSCLSTIIPKWHGFLLGKTVILALKMFEILLVLVLVLVLMLMQVAALVQALDWLGIDWLGMGFGR